MRSFVPTQISVVRMIESPRSNTMKGSARVPTRIFGPCRSWNTAMGIPSSTDALRARSTRLCCSAALPWLKFSRMTRAPPWMIALMVSYDSDAGPIVATILV